MSSKISSRIEEIEEEYDNGIAGIIANMLDYDFEERMCPKDFSIWANRELKNYRKQAETEEQEQNEHNLV